MKLTYIFKRRGRMALAAALGLFVAGPSVSNADLVVLKEGTDIDYTLAGSYSTSPAGGDFGAYTQFLGLGNTATNVHVDDVKMTNNDGASDQNLGQSTTMPNGVNVARASLVKWDLSGLPGFAGSTINAAVVRIYQVGGNGDPVLNTVTYHNFDEATVSIGSPAGNPFGAGPGEWGAASNSRFLMAGDTPNATLGTAPAIDADVVGLGYNTWDATSDLQAMANGTPNYGWAIGAVNDTYLSSENSNNGARPALFIDYTPLVTVPEPSSFLFFSALALGLGWSRKRMS